MDTLEHVVNQFNGVMIKPDALPADPTEFRVRLEHSLAVWREAGYAVVWLEVPIGKPRLIPEAVEAGFGFHHSADTHLMMTHRLIPDALIPYYATHYIGAGGVVLNSRREVLVVVERHRSDRSRPYYKLPGGALHPGEHLADAVVREVYEETGVRAKFDALVCFRHWHGYRYGKSDIYFVCRLSPISEEIHIDVSEIDESMWMPVDDYLSNAYVSPFNRTIVQSALESPGVICGWIDGYADPKRYEFFLPDKYGQFPRP